MSKKLQDVTLREFRFVKDHYNKNITIKRLAEVVKEIASMLKISQKDALEAYKLAMYDTFDMYERKEKQRLAGDFD